MPKQDIPKDANPVFREVMQAIRTGKKYPYDKRKEKLSAAQQKAVEKAARNAARKRKGMHRAGNDVIDSGMFD